MTNIGDETRAWVNEDTGNMSMASKGSKPGRNRKVELNLTNPMNVSIQSNQSRSKNLYDPRKNSKDRKPDADRDGKILL